MKIGGPYTIRYGFEGDSIDKWNIHNNNVEVSSSRKYNGSKSLALIQNNAPSKVASKSIDIKTPTKLSFYYNEKSGSNSAGIVINNSDGDTELGFRTNNPQWEVYSNGKWGRIYNGDGYNRWVKVTLYMNWDENKYKYIVEDLNSNTLRYGFANMTEGKNARTLNIINPGGNDYQTWIDDIELSSIPNPEFTGVGETSVNEKINLSAGIEKNLDGGLDENTISRAGLNPTYKWELGDGTVKYGKNITHSYDNPGNYIIKLHLKSNGLKKTATREITVKNYKKTAFVETFEKGLNKWDVYTDSFTQSDQEYKGSYSGGASSGGLNKRILAEKVLAPNGYKPSKLTYYYYEYQTSHGGGIRIVNSDGEYEVGTATDNPEFDVSSAESIGQRDEGSGYKNWVKVEINFDWKNDEFTYTFEDLNTGRTQTGTESLKHGKDLSKIRIENYNGGWSKGSDFNMWFDNIKVK